MDVYYIIAIISTAICTAWAVPALLMRSFGLHIYGTTQPAKIDAIRRVAKGHSALTFNGKAHGFFMILDPPAVGQISQSSSMVGDITETAWVISSDKTYNEISREPEEEAGEDEPRITLLERSGQYRFIYWEKRRLNVGAFKSRSEQASLITKIKEARAARTSKSAVVYLHGQPGAGKTTIGLLLAKELGGKLTDTYNPTDPGDFLEKLHRDAKPRADKPLIIVINEADVMIERILAKDGVSPHREIPIQVSDKTSWNNLMDKFDVGMYPNTIILLTSNKSKADIDKTDASLLRKGRVHLHLEMQLRADLPNSKEMVAV